MESALIKDLPEREFFKLSPSESAPVWVRDSYDRSSRKYFVYKFDDINSSKLVAGSRAVYVGFTF